MATAQTLPPKVINLHPKQFEAFDFTEQFCAAIAGVRGGKTFLGAAWAGHKLITSPGNGLICAPDYKTLRDVTLNTFFEMFPSYRRFYKESRSVIEIPATKTTPAKVIFCRSLDDPLAAEGLTVDWIWGDEAGKYKLMAWHSMRSRVSLAKGQILLTTTPYNMGWLYQEFYQPWAKHLDSDMKVVTWASVDNPYFPKEVYEAERRRLSPQEFKRRYMGEFTRMQGLVYDLSDFNIIEPREQRADITIGGIDWGWANPAALSVIKLYDGVYYIVDEWYKTGQTTQQIIEAAIALQNKWGINRWYADSANPEKIAEANTNTGLRVFPFEKKKDSISAGVSAINSLILDHRLFVFRGLEYHLDEFGSYQYPDPDDEGKVTRDEPMPMNNHLMDAMRYAIMGYQPALRAAVVPRDGETYTGVEIRRMLGPSPSRYYGNNGENYN